MGKHKNAVQISILLEFMENHPDLAKGFAKREKSLVESLWQKLVAALNAAGPPTKDAFGWRKVWTEWKSEIRKKILHNKLLTNVEESVVRICGISQAVPEFSMAINDDAGVETDDDMSSIFSTKRFQTPETSSTTKKLKLEPISPPLSTSSDDDNNSNAAMHKKMDELISVQKENANSLKTICSAIEKSNESVGKAVTDLKNEIASISVRMLMALQESNQLKKQLLDLELLKFDLERQKN